MTDTMIEPSDASANGEATTTELEPWTGQQQRTVAVYRTPDRDVVDGWVQQAAAVFRLADYIAPTEFVPRTMRNNPAAIAACILAGRELDLGPMTSLRHVQVVEGSPSLSAEYKRARVLQHGHQLQITELSNTRCSVHAVRKGYPPLDLTFTMDDARRANLVKPRGAWETRPRRMLVARVTSEACDFLFSDLVNGLPTTELLEAGEFDELGDTADARAPGAPDGTPAPARAQRQTSPGTRSRKSGSPAAAGPRAPAPPLPGEDPGTGQPAGSEPAAGPGPTKPASGTPRASGDRASAGTSGASAGASQPAGKEGATKPPGDTSAMIKKIQTMFGQEFGIKGRADKLRAVSALAGRRVESSADLTFSECKAVLDAMEEAANVPERGQKVARLMAIVGAWEDSQRSAEERMAGSDEGEPI
jgi:hypothetical protein